MFDIRYNIGQLVKAAGVSTTVRFYERKRLISPIGRAMSNYRQEISFRRFPKDLEGPFPGLENVECFESPRSGYERRRLPPTEHP